MGRPPERAQQLRDLAEALRASAGGAPTRDTAEALGELFAARVERSEIEPLELGGRDGVLDRLRKTGSDAERRGARRIINAWNRICVDAKARETRLRLAAAAASKKRRRREVARADDESDSDDDEDDARSASPAGSPRRRRRPPSPSSQPAPPWEPEEPPDLGANDEASYAGDEEAEWSD